MENKVYVMTAKQIKKAFPLDEELYARLKVLEDSGFEPLIDDEHPDASDETRFTRLEKPSISAIFAMIARIFKKKSNKVVLHTP